MQSEYLNRKDAADYLRAKFGFCSVKSLEKSACVGGGPIFSKMGRLALYKIDDLNAWAASKIGPAQASTSDVGRRA